MSDKEVGRRTFLAAASAGSAWAVANRGIASTSLFTKDASKPAVLGGQPVRTKPFPSWPIWDDADEKAVVPVLRKGRWSRSEMVNEAERKFAELMGTKRCLLTFCGTQALIVALHTVEVGGGDEVIVTPYTFVATIHAILQNNALPVFVDVDPDTWSMDPDKIDEKMTDHTYAILPVHIGGSPCRMDKIMQIANARDLKVVEDACQAHMSEFGGKRVGTFGDFGCFSLQNGKVITCGEGGAVIGNDDETMDRAHSYHNFARPHRSFRPEGEHGYIGMGTKARIAEFQASIVITQMDTSDEEITRREKNGDYLASRLKEIPGLVPRKEYPETTRHSYYTCGFRYKAEQFDGLPRDRFLRAVGAEGIPIGKSLGNIARLSQNREGSIEGVLSSKTFKAIYSEKRIKDYRERLSCPEAEQLVKETVGFSQNLLLGTKEDMDDVVDGVQKVYENRKALIAAS
ncbi:MAG: DegT/DnrJ/EryC1/StrS family aminotransferase [Planctomycetes bacterium]|nr:DegT/DnrJ/EryC1/StrS family aminotransferase [Planctomycetota bacterium]